MFAISITTRNRRPILEKTLEQIAITCPEPHEVYVTDDASTDDTRECLESCERDGLVTEAVYLPENQGIPKARNAHWERCVGKDAIRIDDKSYPLATGWLSALRRISEAHNAVLSVPYNGNVLHLFGYAPVMPFVRYRGCEGGGACMYYPAAVTAKLGMFDELAPYGYDDNLYYERALLLGHEFGFATVVPFQWLTQASQAVRESSREVTPLYEARLKEYRDAERSLKIRPRDSEGWRYWQEVRSRP